MQNCIYYDKEKNFFKYKNNPLFLDETLNKLFFFLTEHQGDYILLEDVNLLFSNADTHESYITINKRRDKAIKDLVFKLSVLLSKDEKDIVLKRKNKDDKRIIEVKLAKNIVKFI